MDKKQTITTKRKIGKITYLVQALPSEKAMDDKTRLAMLQILEERYERKSVIIASQLPIAKWYDYIGDPTLADATWNKAGRKLCCFSIG